MTSAEATIKNKYGIHCRPSTVIAKELQSFKSKVTVHTSDGTEAAAVNVLQIMGLALTCGDTVTISADGPDEKAACKRAVELFEQHFEYVPGE